MSLSPLHIQGTSRSIYNLRLNFSDRSLQTLHVTSITTWPLGMFARRISELVCPYYQQGFMSVMTHDHTLRLLTTMQPKAHLHVERFSAACCLLPLPEIVCLPAQVVAAQCSEFAQQPPGSRGGETESLALGAASRDSWRSDS